MYKQCVCSVDRKESLLLLDLGNREGRYVLIKRKTGGVEEGFSLFKWDTDENGICNLIVYSVFDETPV